MVIGVRVSADHEFWYVHCLRAMVISLIVIPFIEILRSPCRHLRSGTRQDRWLDNIPFGPSWCLDGRPRWSMFFFGRIRGDGLPIHRATLREEVACVPLGVRSRRMSSRAVVVRLRFKFGQRTKRPTVRYVWINPMRRGLRQVCNLVRLI